ncbi:FaeA/PapI family transcriptional regulator [Klebsiella oxytoca]|uniref:FaeA/PapI family transcriptional regulator n=1 Tax=Klebsiella oxytoca TaxID=571 RepID=UPI000CFE9CEE|nr:FaeA/PapI family transcriptional regulator [Klebsiella oxytoca]AVL78893.1 regulator [Klebsiella oxytoca]EKX5082476.1 regulator [Klebsiella oxytoca]EKX5095091.1 regulator [Klebsiella oxytoca]ELQ8984842.1 regulator [Klebsiella oxytoca]NDR46306.1 regulator [Klebsiella oxytoca]
MKIAISPSTPDSHHGSLTAVESLRTLMTTMGINKFSGVNVPEQEYILYVLKEHEPEGLLTRELADRCEMSIYKVRHLLLPLEKYGQVVRIKVNKHHKWYFYNKHID